MVFIYEFTVDSKKHTFSGCMNSGYKGFIKASTERLYFNITIAFSKKKIYGIMINKNAQDYDSFIYFLRWLMIDKQLEDKYENSKWWIIADNAKIHTYVKIQNWWKESKVRLITIWPYSPSLNPAEKLISTIKNKLKKTFFENRLVITFKNLICYNCQKNRIHGL